jgi:flagellar basal body-associated protein FliL
MENSKMADDKEKEKKEAEPKAKQEEKKDVASNDEKPKTESPKSSGFGLFTWLLLGAIVIAGFTGGFALAQLLAGSGQGPAEQTDAPQAGAANAPENDPISDMIVDKPKDEKLWPFELEPVIANLDEPGVTRYARVTITLQLSPQMDREKGTAFLDDKKPILTDWLTTYIAGLNLERVRGTRNLARIKKEIRDSFNELLFPQSKPVISDILFKEFAIQ